MRSHYVNSWLFEAKEPMWRARCLSAYPPQAIALANSEVTKTTSNSSIVTSSSPTSAFHVFVDMVCRVYRKPFRTHSCVGFVFVFVFRIWSCSTLCNTFSYIVYLCENFLAWNILKLSTSWPSVQLVHNTARNWSSQLVGSHKSTCALFNWSLGNRMSIFKWACLASW